MAKARRKMRRALMKKMRKGALTPGERRDLMELDREVNRANRQAAGIGGAGLAAALAVASKAGAGDALGDFLDERKKKKLEEAEKKAGIQRESRAAGDKMAQKVKEGAKKELIDSLPKGKDSESVSQEEIKRRMKAIDGIEIEGLDEEDFKDEALDKDLSDYEIQKAIDANPALAAILGKREAQPDAVQTSKYDSGEGTAFDDLPKNTDYMVDAPVGPTNEPAFSSDDLMRAAREDGPRAEEGREMPDPDRPVMTRHGMDLDTMIRMGARGASEDEREAGLAADLSDYSPEEIQALFRPDLSQAKGGTTPFLRAMRDRIRKKFR